MFTLCQILSHMHLNKEDYIIHTNKNSAGHGGEPRNFMGFHTKFSLESIQATSFKIWGLRWENHTTLKG